MAALWPRPPPPTHLGLARSHLDGLPVRVIRGYEGDPTYSPTSGYRYDGLFRVDEYWHEHPAGPYAEAAHIRALGLPHNGPDVLENLLCLCPNDHVRFDAGAIYIDYSYGVRESGTHTSLVTSRMAPGGRARSATGIRKKCWCMPWSFTNTCGTVVS